MHFYSTCNTNVSVELQTPPLVHVWPWKSQRTATAVGHACAALVELPDPCWEQQSSALLQHVDHWEHPQTQAAHPGQEESLVYQKSSRPEILVEQYVVTYKKKNPKKCKLSRWLRTLAGVPSCDPNMHLKYQLGFRRTSNLPRPPSHILFFSFFLQASGSQLDASSHLPDSSWKSAMISVEPSRHHENSDNLRQVKSFVKTLFAMVTPSPGHGCQL